MRLRTATGSRVVFIGRHNGIVIKLRPSILGRAERFGYERIAPHFPVPKRLGYIDLGRTSIGVFAKVPVVSRDAGLLADAFRLERADLVLATVESHARCIIKSARVTGEWVQPVSTVAALYQDRARVRLREWWGSGGSDTLKHVRSFGWRINDTNYSARLSEILERMLKWADDTDSYFTLLSQGDPNEMNLASPLVYLDFKYAGRNVLLGEIANFCWAVLGQGSYYAPTYNPTSFHGHISIRKAAPFSRPYSKYELDEVDEIVGLKCDHRLSAIRRRAANLFLQCVWPCIQTRYQDTGIDPEAGLTHFLLARILLTFDPRQMTAPDLVFVAASAVHAYAMGGKRYLEALATGEIS